MEFSSTPHIRTFVAVRVIPSFAPNCYCFTRRRSGRDERLSRDLRTDVTRLRVSDTLVVNDVTSSVAAVAWHADCTARLSANQMTLRHCVQKCLNFLID
jgi:hypothetical protein